MAPLRRCLVRLINTRRECGAHDGKRAERVEQVVVELYGLGRAYVSQILRRDERTYCQIDCAAGGVSESVNACAFAITDKAARSAITSSQNISPRFFISRFSSVNLSDRSETRTHSHALQ